MDDDGRVIKRPMELGEVSPSAPKHVPKRQMNEMDRVLSYSTSKQIAKPDFSKRFSDILGHGSRTPLSERDQNSHNGSLINKTTPLIQLSANQERRCQKENYIGSTSIPRLAMRRRMNPIEKFAVQGVSPLSDPVHSTDNALRTQCRITSMFDQVSSLDTSRTNWKIKVRVTRMWPSVSSKSETNNSLKGYNLILLDDDNSHIQAFVYADNWKAFADVISAGGVYVISNFYTREATGSLRTTSSKVLINFSNSTTVEKVTEDDFMIPQHKFELVDLGDLFRIASKYENVENPEHAIDIMGVVEDFENAKPIKTMYGDRMIARFRITDGRYSHKVSVWGQLAVSTDAIFKKIVERPVIAIVTSTKLKTYRSSVQISTLPSSKIYLDLEHEFVTAMKTRLEAEGYKAPETIAGSPTAAPSLSILETIGLKELSEKTNTDDLKKNFLCLAKIVAVEETVDWWFLSCVDCKTEVYHLEGKYKCSKCDKNIPVAEKRYKIVVLAGDETEAYNFVLTDRAARRVIGQTATKLIADNLQNGANIYPEKIKEIVGKDFTFTVEISSDNVLLNSKIFTVMDAYPITESTSASTVNTLAGFAPSSESDNTIDLTKAEDTPGTSKSTSKRIKTEV